MWSVGLCVLVVVTASCTSAEEKCAAARKGAVDAWGGYLEHLERDVATATKVQGDTQVKLSGDVEKRLAAGARKSADERYKPGSGAWMRAFIAAKSAACSDDEECSELRRQNVSAADDKERLGKLIESANEVQKLLAGDLSKGREAADALERNFEYDEMQPARVLMAEAVEACADL